MPRTEGLPVNIAAFLDMIAVSELGQGLIDLSDDGYNVIVGSTPRHPILFTSYADHPRKKMDLPNLHIISTAAGRYQVLMRFYDSYKKLLDLPDFSPESQDAIACQYIRERHAWPYVVNGKLEKALELCSTIWASLPWARYGQHTNKLENLQKVYVQKGGRIHQ